MGTNILAEFAKVKKGNHLAFEADTTAWSI